MCLIVAKPAGINMPSKRRLKFWFRGHPDGFGFAYLNAGVVHIVKGAMTKREMFQLLGKAQEKLGEVRLANVDVLLHFRQATKGSICPSNCHPFPLTKDEKDLSALEIEASCAVTHNGIIFDYSYWGGVSYSEPAFFYQKGQGESKTDTQQFIEDYLVDLKSALWNLAVQKLLVSATFSKFALLSKKGITYIGEFIEDGGCYYSNLGYKKPAKLGSKPMSYIDRCELGVLDEHRGSTCEFCEQSVYVRYPLNSSLVCFACFERLEGISPIQYFAGRPEGGVERGNPDTTRS